MKMEKHQTDAANNNNKVSPNTRK